jgi:hypothetical protein
VNPTRTLIRATSLFAVLSLGIIANPQCLGQIIPVSQARSVSASAAAAVAGDSNSESDSALAPAFDPFDVEIDPLAIAIGSGEITIAQGVARQHSSLLPGSVSASGEASTSLALLTFTGGSASSDGDSLFDLVFTLGALSSFTFAGSVDTQAIVTGGASIPLFANDIIFTDVDNATVLFQTLTQDESFNLAGILSPGTYRLTAAAGIEAEQLSNPNSARTVAGTSSFEFNLRLRPSTVPDSGGGLVGIAAVALGVFALWQTRGKQVRS